MNTTPLEDTNLIRVLCRGGATLTGRSLNHIAQDTFGIGAFYRPTPEHPEVLGKMLAPITGETGAWWVCAIILEITKIPEELA